MNLAIVLVHNKENNGNFQQIEDLKVLLNKVIEKFETYHYELKGIDIPHIVKIYQILPFQPSNHTEPYEGIWPDNVHDLDSYNVAYGWGDEDKIGDHPRFFNWGLKRATDYAADVVIHLEDGKKLDINDLNVYLNSLIDPEDKHEFADVDGYKVSTLKLLKEVGQLDESKDLSNSIVDFKSRVEKKGLENG